MSLKLKKATFINKKVVPNEVTFETEDIFTSVISNNSEDLKSFKTILTGKYLVKSGYFKIDGYDKVNKDWTKQHVDVISMSKNLRKWPEKFWLSTYLLLNKEFYNNAKINYLNDKYDYLSYSTSYNITEDLNMRKKVEKMILTFINSSIEIEEQWLQDFLNQQINFNNKNLEEKNETLEEHIKIIVKDYYFLIDKTLNYELLETFLQSLWDKVYNFMELTSLCKCEYIAKKSKDKSTKKLAKHLNFNQVNYVVRKQLKIIDVKISHIRNKILKNKNIILSLKKQINFEMIKLNKINKKLKNLDVYFGWRQASNDQRSEFVIKQEKMFFDGLTDESTTLRGKIVEVIHGFHKQILKKDISYKKTSLFKTELKALKSKINTMSEQSKNYINDLCEKLDLKLDLFSIKWNGVINIWYLILKSIFLKKYNLIFYKVLEKLSLNETRELFHVLNNLYKLDNNYKFIFLDTQIQNVACLNKEFYLINKSKILKLSFSDFIKNNWNSHASEIFYNNNKIQYERVKDKVIILNNKIKSNSLSFNAKGYIILDPLKLSSSKKETKNNLFEIKGYIKDNKLFSDEKVKYFVSDDKQVKLYFYSDLNYKAKQKISVYVTEDAIFKVI
ncbi:hypothetical protein [Spiroplasma turonicum]|uniref:Uncharacterized protein n=1 Tax=Spiroplasma turonicum TaxID=216946 RepID=A0A0K1P7L9_9MOLU|nr:hypothetical protein [Spiroplasma turonicum]AKU80293.1 hypothetical protein STURON_001047 [Spiroplasma turonicum]ALX71294.1 hypothetical protein STURO_v1c10430 [Spiroplasma turonicum]